MGRCLAHVSKRPSAKELLLDPFLATKQHEVPLLNTTTNQTLKVNSTQALANYKHLSIGDPTTSIKMKITGSINEEDNTIFLKVRICDEIGMHNSFMHK